MKLVLASSNAHKVTEFKRMLEGSGIEVISKDEAGVKEFNPEETEKTFEGNAKIKAKAMYELTGMPSVADDSGLIVDALNGEPGIYSARYAGENATDKEKYELVLKKLENIPDEKRTARFACSICCYISENEIVSVTGYCEGKIGFEAKGENGFGYDPIFMPEAFGYKKSFSQLDDSEKDSVSHRHEAMRLFVEKIKNKELK